MLLNHSKILMEERGGSCWEPWSRTCYLIARFSVKDPCQGAWWNRLADEYTESVPQHRTRRKAIRSVSSSFFNPSAPCSLAAANTTNEMMVSRAYSRYFDTLYVQMSVPEKNQHFDFEKCQNAAQHLCDLAAYAGAHSVHVLPIVGSYPVKITPHLDVTHFKGLISDLLRPLVAPLAGTALSRQPLDFDGILKSNVPAPVTVQAIDVVVCSVPSNYFFETWDLICSTLITKIEIDASKSMGLTRLPEAFPQMVHLRELHLSGCNATARYQNVALCPELRKYTLVKCTLNETALSAVAALPHLSELRISECLFRQSTYLSPLCLCPSLVALQLESMGIRSLPKELPRLTSLSHLSIRGCQELTSFSVLSLCSKLEVLDVGSTKFDDEALAELAQSAVSHQLTSLLMGKCRLISNESFPLLARFTGLSEIELAGLDLTEVAVEVLSLLPLLRRVRLLVMDKMAAKLIERCPRLQVLAWLTIA